MINGPETDDLDRLMALDDAAFQQEATAGEPKESQEPSPPAPAAAPPAPAADAGGQAATVGSGEPAAADTDDWLASLPEDVQTRIKADRAERERQIEESENRFKALHGRVAPIQQRLSELERAHASRTTSQPTAAPPVQQPGQTLDSYFDSTDWKEWSETFPGDAKVMRASLEAQDRVWQERFARLEGRYQNIEQRLEQTVHTVQSRTVDDEASKLEAAHSDWREINNSDEFWNWFEGWKLTQPKSQRGQYYDPEALQSLWNDSDFAIARISEYKTTVAPPAAPTPPAPAAQTPPESTQPAQPPARNPRLSMSVAPEVRGAAVPPAVSTEGMSEAQLFDHLWNTTP